MLEKACANGVLPPMVPSPQPIAQTSSTTRPPAPEPRIATLSGKFGQKHCDLSSIGIGPPVTMRLSGLLT